MTPIVQRISLPNFPIAYYAPGVMTSSSELPTSIQTARYWPQWPDVIELSVAGLPRPGVITAAGVIPRNVASKQEMRSNTLSFTSRGEVTVSKAYMAHPWV